MATQWFKFYGADYLIDPKVKSLTASERSCLVTLLCYASTAEIAGEIKYLKEFQLMVDAGLDPSSDEWDNTKGILERLKDLEVIKTDSNGVITFINFRKRQDVALSNYERVKKYREKKRLDNEFETGETEMITVEENRKEENRKEEKIEISEKSPSPAQIAKFFFSDTNEYSRVGLDLVLKGIPQNVAATELKKFHSYWTEPNKSGTKQRWELEKTFELGRRLAKWFSNYPQFNQNKKTIAIRL